MTGGGAGVGGGSAGRGQDVTSKTSTSYVPGKYTKKFFNSIVAGVAGSPVGGSSSASGSAANDDDAVRTREEVWAATCSARICFVGFDAG